MWIFAELLSSEVAVDEFDMPIHSCLGFGYTTELMV